MTIKNIYFICWLNKSLLFKWQFSSSPRDIRALGGNYLLILVWHARQSFIIQCMLYILTRKKTNQFSTEVCILILWHREVCKCIFLTIWDGRTRVRKMRQQKVMPHSWTCPVTKLMWQLYSFWHYNCFQSNRLPSKMEKCNIKAIGWF